MELRIAVAEGMDIEVAGFYDWSSPKGNDHDKCGHEAQALPLLKKGTKAPGCKCKKPIVWIFKHLPPENNNDGKEKFPKIGISKY